MSTSTDTPALTETQITEFFLAQLQALQPEVPGYTTLTLSVNVFKSTPPDIRWTVYNEHVKSHHTPTLTEAISKTRQVTNGRDESQILRDQAAALLKRAELLEEKGNPGLKWRIENSQADLSTLTPDKEAA